MTRLSSMSEKDRNAITKYYAQSRQSLTEKWNRKILADQKKYGKSSKEVAKDEAAKKKALQKQELKFATSVTAKEARLHTTLDGKIKLSANKQESIIKKLTKEKGKLSKKQLEQALIDSNKERKTVSANANKQYKLLFGLLIRSMPKPLRLPKMNTMVILATPRSNGRQLRNMHTLNVTMPLQLRRSNATIPLKKLMISIIKRLIMRISKIKVLLSSRPINIKIPKKIIEKRKTIIIQLGMVSGRPLATGLES